MRYKVFVKDGDHQIDMQVLEVISEVEMEGIKKLIEMYIREKGKSFEVSFSKELYDGLYQQEINDEV